ncbi:MAG: MCE family protein, partial [Moorea sp. SIO4G2]|nr:MCE family protein [Moorena sp. SIO4G2]
LVSSTEQLQQQALISQQLEALNTAIDTASSNELAKTVPIPKSPSKIDLPKIDPIAPADQNVKPNQEKQMFKLLPPAPRKSVK